MAISLIEYKQKKPGCRWHPDKKKWVAYRIDVRVGGVRYRNRRFATRMEAEKFIDALRLEQTYKKENLKFPKPGKVLLSDLFARHAQKIKTARAKRLFDRVTKDFLCLFEYEPKVMDAKPAHFQIYINRRMAAGVKSSTVDREITALSAPFRRAFALFPAELAEYVAPPVPRPKYKKTPRQKIISEKEKNQICAWLRQPKKENEHHATFQSRAVMAAMFHLAWLLGLRFGEIKNLQKKDYSAKDGVLTVFRSKTDSFTVFEFLPVAAKEILESSLKTSTSDFIFDLKISDASFYRILAEACRANNIEYGRNKAGGLVFHANRHSFTTRLVQITDIATAAAFTGHSDRSMVAYYAHASDQSKKNAMQKLYGAGTELDRGKLREIFEKVKSEKLNFEDFCEVLGKMWTNKNGGKS